MTPEVAKKVLAALEALDVIDGTPDRESLDMCIEIMKREVARHEALKEIKTDLQSCAQTVRLWRALDFRRVFASHQAHY